MTFLKDIIAVPFGYLMELCCRIFPNYLAALAVFTVLLQILLALVFGIKQQKNSVKQALLAPKVAAIRKKYAGRNDQQTMMKMNEETQALYTANGYSPYAGCLPMLVQLPIIMGLYYVISQPLSYFFQLNADQITSLKDVLKGLGVTIEKSTSQITIAGYIKDNFEALKGISDSLMPVDFHFLGLDLASVPNFKKFDIIWIIPVFSALTAYGQSWLMQKIQERKTGAPMAGNKTMFIMMPLMSLFFGFTLPAGLSLYWVCNNIFGAVSEIVFSMIIDKESVK